MCRKGAWAELTVEVTSGSDGSKPDARFKKNKIPKECFLMYNHIRKRSFVFVQT